MLPKTQPNFERVSMSSQLSSSRSLKKRDWLIDQTPYFPREYQKHTIGEEKTKLLSEISTKKLENFNDQDLEKYFAEKVGGQDGSI